ncbi:hypothetical protein C8F04DRAFT_1083126 [Mycena alexandri]|uniref:Smr domain-containing protein n=1 Tax=Mycena alexandri TaxID=1745969 RepID=A0AAD6T6Z2_9AGAR|nr:hypothetical protein C8F04DRAFT_1083126 [Mycena alexandri]
MDFWTIAIVVYVLYLLFRWAGSDGENSSASQNDRLYVRSQPTPSSLPVHGQYGSLYGAQRPPGQPPTPVISSAFSSYRPITSPPLQPVRSSDVRIIPAPAQSKPSWQSLLVHGRNEPRYGTQSTPRHVPRASTPPGYRPLRSHPIGTPSPQPLRSITAPQPLLPPPPRPLADRPPLTALSSPNLPLPSSDVTAPPPPPRRNTWAGDNLPLSSDALRERVAELRKQAAEEGDLMAKAFTRSQTFRRDGFRLEARKLAKQGREHQQSSETLNKTACDMIFNDINQDREPNEVDLHGLFVKEAELKVAEAVLAAEQRGDVEVRFIVGQGIHSSDGPRLKPALVYYIGQMPGRSVHPDPRNAGVLVVPLRLNGADDGAPKKRRHGKGKKRPVS